MAASYSNFLLAVLEHTLFLSVLFDGTFLRVNVYPFQVPCLARWLFRLLLSSSFLVVSMTSQLVIFAIFQSRLPNQNFFHLQRWWRVTLIFLLQFLIFEGRLKNLSFQERFRDVLLLLYLLLKSLDEEKSK